MKILFKYIILHLFILLTVFYIRSSEKIYQTVENIENSSDDILHNFNHRKLAARLLNGTTTNASTFVKCKKMKIDFL